MRFLEKHDLGGLMLDAVNLHLKTKGIKIATGEVQGMSAGGRGLSLELCCAADLKGSTGGFQAQLGASMARPLRRRYSLMSAKLAHSR